MNRDAPLGGVIEVSLFGRGYGEAAAIHVGAGKWIVVDSLRDANGTPSILSYLEEIGIDPSVSIETIVATHWHDDHIDGIAEVFSVARRAKLVMPNAFRSEEFAAFVGDTSTLGTARLSSGVREIERIANLRGSRTIRLASANKKIFSATGSEFPHKLDVEVEALSPSDADVQSFLKRISAVRSLTTQCRMDAFSPNESSVALWVKIGAVRLLLGGDLEVGSSDHSGWRAILSGDIQPHGKAEVFKIPHHGSVNADLDEIWTRYVERNPISILTTWNRGKKLPTRQGVENIIRRTPHGHITSNFAKKYSSPINIVNRQLKSSHINMKSLPAVAGHVRLRLDPATGSGWAVSHFNGAIPLERFSNASFT